MVAPQVLRGRKRSERTLRLNDLVIQSLAGLITRLRSVSFNGAQTENLVKAQTVRELIGLLNDLRPNVGCLDFEASSPKSHRRKRRFGSAPHRGE
jgi:hypothetical protein